MVDSIQLTLNWVDRAHEDYVKDLNGKMEIKLLETLATITHGKMFLEVERARIVKLQADIKEGEGDIAGAAAILQEVQVETFGGMSRRDKTEYILEQMRLVLENNDFIRCQILSKKINVKVLAAADLEDLRIRYFGYMIRYYEHHKGRLIFDEAQAYLEVFKAPSIYNDENRWKQYLIAYALRLVVAPMGDMRNGLLEDLRKEEKKKLVEIPEVKKMVDAFLHHEIFNRPVSWETFMFDSTIFEDNEIGKFRKEMFLRRSLQHDLLVCAKNYMRMPLQRISDFTHASIEDIENEIADLVDTKATVAKINRPLGVVHFGPPRTAKAVLDNWVKDVSTALDLVEDTAHIIEKERMVTAAKKQGIIAAKAAMGQA
eukprot:GHVO01043804.1.p1 GENE.GHVO01043804.1~~GHVO01043804.1.p1  ORF type:complete len:425 (+),score=97.10 GHVO01043804.1:161-1276(+)